MSNLTRLKDFMNGPGRQSEETMDNLDKLEGIDLGSEAWADVARRISENAEDGMPETPGVRVIDGWSDLSSEEIAALPPDIIAALRQGDPAQEAEQFRRQGLI